MFTSGVQPPNIGLSGTLSYSVTVSFNPLEHVEMDRFVENFIRVSAHINRLLGYFDQYFDHATLSKAEQRQIQSHSDQLHLKLLVDGDLKAYDQHLELAKQAYKKMLLKMGNQQIIEDILFCGSSDLSWKESSRSLSDLYQLELHSMEIYTFYYLHEINNQFYIDSPLPMKKK